MGVVSISGKTPGRVPFDVENDPILKIYIDRGQLWTHRRVPRVTLRYTSTHA